VAAPRTEKEIERRPNSRQGWVGSRASKESGMVRWESLVGGGNGGAGALVGLLRRLFGVPVKLAGTVQELKDQRVEPSTAPGAVVVPFVSLVGGGKPRARGGAGDDGWRARRFGCQL
jgi:hypothetical protein